MKSTDNSSQTSSPSNNRLFFSAGLIMLGVSVILSACARLLPGFAQAYSVHIYPILTGTLGRISGLFPISLSEIGLYLLGAFLIYALIRFVRKPLVLLSRIFFAVNALLLLFTGNCGINYYRNSFSYEAGMKTSPSSAEELYALCEYLAEQINQTVSEAAFTGQTEDTPLPSARYLKEAGSLGQEALSGLGDVYPQFAGWYPYPKPLINPWILSVQQLCGIYSPFTIEANYNREMPYYNIPHTICHELSHLKGYMREDEANFIGYLACILSPSPDFRYSGYLTGWVYAGNALAGADPEGYFKLYETLDERAVADLKYNNGFWDRYEGKAAEASSQLNDRYLKAHDQTDGVKSYGRMVDLMLTYYQDKL